MLRHLLLILLMFAGEVYGQASYVPETIDELRPAASPGLLAFEDFYQLVVTYHPLVRQAYLLEDVGREEIRLARGGFDPRLSFGWQGKEFKETEYFNLVAATLKIPTWFPLDPVVGFERNRGTYLNPENFISEGTNYQQVFSGISLPVGRGLFIDERRATVQQAELFAEMNQAEQVSIINKVLLQAAKDYWDWRFTWQYFLLNQQSIEIAEEIFDRTLMAFQFGEAAAIDTVQAKITLISRRAAFQQATIDKARATLQLSNHLWDESGRPMELREEVAPAAVMETRIDESVLVSLLALAQENHPDLQKLSIKAKQLSVKEKLAIENLKPRLNLQFYWLDQPINTGGNWTGFGIEDNYKFGVDFEFPLFLRKERGKLNQTRLMQVNNALEQDYQTWQVINNINKEFLNVRNMDTLMDQQQQIVENYTLMLQAEQLNLENGESDLFRINIQLDKLIESQTKLLKMQAEYQKSLATLYWQAGVSNLTYTIN